VEAAYRVLRHPTVASKSFLITIGDRTVGGFTARDQFVGPWQMPVADVAVTTLGYDTNLGEAMAMGERGPIALIDPAASGRMAVGEAVTNLAAAAVNDISDIRLSANWMAAAGHPGEDAALFDTVRAVGKELCPALDISIPVGKDSMSMRTLWQENGEKKAVVSPLSLIITAFAPSPDARRVLTPQLRTDAGETDLILFDLGRGQNRLGGSVLGQVYGELGDACPDLEEPARLKTFFALIQRLNAAGKLLAYHDRADGGLFATVCEMAFAGRCGVNLDVDELRYHRLHDDIMLDVEDAPDPHEPYTSRLFGILFNEELGAVVQVRRERYPRRHGRHPGGRPARRVLHHRQHQPEGPHPRPAGRRGGVRRIPRRPAGSLVRDQLPHAGPARQPGLRQGGVQRTDGEEESGPAREARLRPE
jgi:phosphoribosylformylglycinamidine synthase